MFCPKCGKQIDDDSVFCEYCGENVEEIPAADPFQTVYADDNAYDNNDYNDHTYNYADNYADDYNNAYPANFTEPQPIPNPAPEKSGKKMIAAVCAACSVMLVLMAVLCAKFIFGGKKIQTDDSSANSLAAVVTTAADSSSVVAEESSAAETAVTTAATTAPAAKSEKKAPLSAIQLKGMTVSEIRDYVGDDYELGYGNGKFAQYVGITSSKYFDGILVAGMKYNGDFARSGEDAMNAFLSSENDDLYPSVYVLEGTKGLIGYDLRGDEVRSGLTFEYLLTAIDCMNGLEVPEGHSRSIIEGYVVDLYFDININEPMGQYGVSDMSDKGEGVRLNSAEVFCNVTESSYMSGSQKARIVTNTAPLLNAPRESASTLVTLEKGAELYIGELYDPFDVSFNLPKNQLYYEVRRYDFYDKYWNKIVYKVGYIRADMIEFE